MFFLNSEKYKIYYKDVGDKKDTPIIFLHAWGSNHHDFDYTIENLTGYRKIAYDHRGFGLSEKPNRDMSLARLAKDLKELIEYLELENVILVGYSMGAGVIYKYIDTYGNENLKGIVICDMTPYLLNEDGWEYGIMFGRFGREELLKSIASQFDDMKKAYLDLYIQINPSLEGKNTSVLKRVIEKDLSGNSYYSITSMWFSLCSEDFRETVKKIKVPTALFFADPGSLVNPKSVEYLKENIDNTYIHMFEKSTHSFINNKPKYFTKELEKFLNIIK
ncbi:alpha/beta fold hydrolase [Peptostreptococcus faecalis]|uniref:alpha/beta fold hydrolase n=1 Tax=Peptostreptococcus faecalis TaxID=2045015 RepID=UPI000C7D52CA|nr:alpha/beta hydrolase [Peptostreptococcus faecalis]